MRVHAEMVEVLAAESGKGLSIKAAFAREAGSPGEDAVLRDLTDRARLFNAMLF